MRKLVWVVCGVSVLILIAAAPVAIWLRARGSGRWLGGLTGVSATRASQPGEVPKPTWKSDPEALAAAGLPDPSKATLGLAAVDAKGTPVGVRSILPWMVGEPNEKATCDVGTMLAQELDLRVSSLPPLYNAVGRNSISSFSHAADYDGEGLEAERKASLLAAQRLGQDCVLLGHVTGKADKLTVEAELYDVGTGEPVGEPWTLTGDPEGLCARDGELLQEALRRAEVDVEPEQQKWLQAPLTTNEEAFRLGLDYIAGSEDGDALPTARKLLEIAPEFLPSYGYLIGAERVSGSCMNAARAIRAVVDKGNVQPRQLLTAVLIATDSGEWEWGNDMIARHKAVQPKSFLRSRRAISHYLAQGKHETAVAYAEELIELNPRSALAWWVLGSAAHKRASTARAGKYVVHMDRKQYAVFASEMERAGVAIPLAAEMDPLNRGLLVALLDAYRETGDRTQTEKVFQYVRQLYPTDPTPYSPMLWLYRKGYWNKPDKLEALRKELDEFEPETAAERFELGRIMHKNKRPAGVRRMREVLKEAGTTYWPQAHATLAGILGRDDKTAAEGEKHARIALRQRYSESAHRALVAALSNQDKHAEATEEAARFVKHFPKDDDAHWMHGQALLAAKEYVQAAKAFERAHAIERRHIGAARQCVRSWLVIGKIEPAKKKLYEMEQDSLYTKRIKAVHWANYFLAAGEYDHALEWYDRAAKETPGELAVKLNRGYCYLCMGDYRTARKIWRKYGPPEGQDTEYDLDMAFCDLMAGEKASAVRRYRKIKARDPEFCKPENLRYRFMPPRCIELVKTLDKLSAAEEAKASAQ